LNCLEAYYFIANNYEIGDEIMLFGFSRGAYTARCVAGLLTQFDIIERSKMDLFPILFEAYKNRKPNKDGKGTDLDNIWKSMSKRKESNDDIVGDGLIGYHEAEIKVIGCFDTVVGLFPLCAQSSFLVRTWLTIMFYHRDPWESPRIHTWTGFVISIRSTSFVM